MVALTFWLTILIVSAVYSPTQLFAVFLFGAGLIGLFATVLVALHRKELPMTEWGYHSRLLDKSDPDGLSCFCRQAATHLTTFERTTPEGVTRLVTTKPHCDEHHTGEGRVHELEIAA